MKRKIKHIIITAILILITLAISAFLFVGIRFCVDLQNIRPEKEKIVLHDRKAKTTETAVAKEMPKQINEGYKQTLTKSGGVYYFNGLRETWFSSNVSRHYRINEGWVDDNGFYRTTEGYFVVAYTMTMPIGTIINISMGQAMVLDHCPTEGTVDVYVCW